jgi:hypothetical protein
VIGNCLLNLIVESEFGVMEEVEEKEANGKVFIVG